MSVFPAIPSFPKEPPELLIRHALRNALLGETVAGSRIYPHRPTPASAKLAPSIFVFQPEQSVSEEREVEAPLVYTMECVLEVHAIVRSEKDSVIDDALDWFGHQIKAALFRDQTLHGTCQELTYAGSQFDVQDGVDHPIGSVVQRWRARYRLPAPEESAPIPEAPAELANVKWVVPTWPDYPPIPTMEDEYALTSGG